MARILFARLGVVDDEAGNTGRTLEIGFRWTKVAVSRALSVLCYSLGFSTVLEPHSLVFPCGRRRNNHCPHLSVVVHFDRYIISRFSQDQFPCAHLCIPGDWRLTLVRPPYIKRPACHKT